MTDARTEIEKMILAWADAVHKRDIEGAVANHSDDFLMFDVVGPTSVRGIEAYRRSWLEQFFPWHGENGRFALSALEVHAGDTVAFVTGILDCAGTEHGKSVCYAIRLTVGLERQEGRWIVIHEHHSQPVEAP